MSSKKSELHHPSAAAARGWRRAFLANAPLPILLLLTWPLGMLLQSEWAGTYTARIATLIGYNIILAVSLQLINGFSGQFSLGHAGFMAVGAYAAAYAAKNYAVHADDQTVLVDPASTLFFFIALALTTALIAAILYAILAAVRTSRKIAPALPVILFIALIVWLLMDIRAAATWPTVPAHLVWSKSFSLTQELFEWLTAHGATAGAKVSAKLPETMLAPLAYLILLSGGALCAAVAGFVIGLPALRLRGDYLAIATLGMAEILRVVIQTSPALGGALGIGPLPRYTNIAWLYSAVIVTVVVIWRVAYSPRGRQIMAVREDEIAAAAVGINTTRQKVTAFVIGACFAGLGGALFALNEYSVTPTRFTLDRSIELVVMVTLGGLGSISGAILAAIVLTLLPEVLRPIADLRMIIYSLLLVLMMLLRPQGLLGGRELWFRRRGARPVGVAPTLDVREPGIA
jgi:branched-chain amino acid transport system permease protein